MFQTFHQQTNASAFRDTEEHIVFEGHPQDQQSTLCVDSTLSSFDPTTCVYLATSDAGAAASQGGASAQTPQQPPTTMASAHLTPATSSRSSSIHQQTAATGLAATDAILLRPHQDQQMQEDHAQTLCQVCFLRQAPRSGGSVWCSKRCEWLATARCPQCGRDCGRQHAMRQQQNGIDNSTAASTAVFCSSRCYLQAQQANWCVFCAVRQNGAAAAAESADPTAMAAGGTCGAQACLYAAFNHQPQQPQQQQGNEPPHHDGRYHQQQGRGYGGKSAQYQHYQQFRNGRHTSSAAHNHHPHHHSSNASAPYSSYQTSLLPHEVLPASDRTFQQLANLFAKDVGHVYSVVKINSTSGASATAHRKQYLQHRSAVEAEMSRVCGHGAPKYGNGGEGNEQRRFVPLAIGCDALVGSLLHSGNNHNNGEPGARGQNTAVGGVATCGDAGGCCPCCRVLTSGLRLRPPQAVAVPTQGDDQNHQQQQQQVFYDSHYTTAAPAVAAPWCQGSASQPQVSAMLVCRAVVGNPLIVRSAAEVRPPEAPFHSVVIQDSSSSPHGDTSRDGTYVFSDNALMPQYLVLFASTPAAMEAAAAAAYPSIE